jgi:hypothetical protein
MRGIRSILRWQTIPFQPLRLRPVLKVLHRGTGNPIRQIRTRGTIEGAREAEEGAEGAGKAVEGEAMREEGVEEKDSGRMTSAAVIRKLIWVGGNTSVLRFSIYSLHN